MIINKSTVIKALRTEPLQAGFFFRSGDEFLTGDVKYCDVCAVGAVVRKSLGQKVTKFDSGHLSSYCKILTKDKFFGNDIKNLLNKKNYLGALSNYFEENTLGMENERTETNSKEFREKLVAFVKKNFPTRFKVSDIE